VLLGSLLTVALWEFCRPRRREFPALRRRLGNIGFWVFNLALVLRIKQKIHCPGSIPHL
jgi:hypothetical protein